jgi:mono/diheme cytochrome c family protein
MSALRNPFVSRAAIRALVALAACGAAVLPGAAEDRSSDFERQVRPIFASRCYACHGPKKQTSGLRLDEVAAALAGGDSGAAIVPGKAAASPLIERVTSTDDAIRMPPEGQPLTADEIDVLRRWIDAGAKWPDADSAAAVRQHWSLRPLVRPPIPTTPADLHSPIDRFIADRLAEHKLSLSPEAERRTLIRRLSFDLVGLPPTPEEVAAFVADPHPLAYERLVERLLASPQHGERWAQHWLDAVRFAESDGFETNKPRANAWPYRDWVIAALNSDKPYDQFVLEQLAGDALGADAATGFLVGGANDVVKSPDPVLTAQQRADVLHDIVSTTGSAFLGLTVGCARCHGHKFDPIPQADYYALKAVFAGVDHGERPRVVPPDPKRSEQLAALVARRHELDAMLLRYEPLADTTSDPQALAVKKRLRPAVHPRLNVERFAPIAAKRVRMTVTKTNTISPCIDELEAFTAEAQPRNVALASAGAIAAASSVYPNSEIHKLEHINDGRYGNGRSWISNEPGGWVELTLPAAVTIEAVRWGRDREEKFTDRLALEYTLEVADEAGTWTVVATHRDREPFVAGKALDPAAAIGRLPAAEQDAAQAAFAERARIEAEIKQLSEQPMLYSGVFAASPGATHRFHRGDPMQPREEIAPGALRAIAVVYDAAGEEEENPDGKRRVPATLTEDQRRRLALARWIVDPANPLTPRVIVNRLWQHHFGEGLVATPSDFGANGARPSHPELLDWLAAELVEHGWSLRHVHRLIVQSATYRQASAHRSEAAAIDAQSRLLWRYPPRRLEAEPIRDVILAMSGKLDLALGGPGFLPFEPNDNYVRVYNPKQSFGPADFRRMIYMTKIRMQQEGTFGAFDCPDGGQIAPRRSQSTTPLQALNLLNSPFCTEQAEAFAARIEHEAGGAISAQVRRAFALAYQREPAPEELAASEAVVRKHGLAILCRAILSSNEFLYVD